MSTEDPSAMLPARLKSRTCSANWWQLILPPPRPSPVWDDQQRVVICTAFLSFNQKMCGYSKQVGAGGGIRLGGEEWIKWKTKSLKAQSRIAALVGVCKQRIGWISVIPIYESKKGIHSRLLSSQLLWDPSWVLRSTKYALKYPYFKKAIRQIVYSLFQKLQW